MAVSGVVFRMPGKSRKEVESLAPEKNFQPTQSGRGVYVSITTMVEKPRSGQKSRTKGLEANKRTASSIHQIIRRGGRTKPDRIISAPINRSHSKGKKQSRPFYLRTVSARIFSTQTCVPARLEAGENKGISIKGSSPQFSNVKQGGLQRKQWRGTR